jgi:hypothetical protein
MEKAPLQLKFNWIGAGPFILKDKIVNKLLFEEVFDKFALHLEGTSSSPVQFNWRGSFSLLYSSKKLI